jgi:hypothetical protein
MKYIKEVFVRGLGWRDVEEIMDNNFTVQLSSTFKVAFPIADMEGIMVNGVTFIREFNHERNET